MREIWLLTKVQLGTAFDFNISNKSRNLKKRSPFFIVGVTALLLLLAGTSFFYSFMLGSSFIQLNTIELMPEFMMAITCLVTIITTVNKVKGTLFGFKDYDLVMSLPVTTSKIVASRLLLLYLLNILFTCIVMVPNSIAYGILVKPSPVFYIISFVMMLFIPLVPMIVAMMIGTVIAVIASRFRRSNLVNLIIVTAFFVLYMVFVFTADSAEKMGEITTAITNQVDNMYLLARMFRGAVCEYDIISIVLFIGISLGAFIMFSLIVGVEFKSINTKILSNFTRGNYKVGSLKQSSPFKALLVKEAKRYFSSTLYVLNTGFGVVIMFLGSVASLFLSKETFAEIFNVPVLGSELGQLIAIMFGFCVAMTNVTACSISLEGRNLWILKESPVTEKTIFNSKIALNLILTIPAILINSIIVFIGLHLSLLDLFIIILLPTAFAFFVSIFGLLVNLKMPNLNWTSEVTVIKQSGSTTIAVLLNMFLSFLPFILMLVLNIRLAIINGLMALVLLILSGIMYRYINTKGVKIFEQL
jgi:ABC-2 type transport system permease protein